MITPIPLIVTLGMSSSGWKLQRVFNTCIEKINAVKMLQMPLGQCHGISQIMNTSMR
jgi:hypothetical protein